MNCIPKQRCGNCGTTGNNLPKIHIYCIPNDKVLEKELVERFNNLKKYSEEELILQETKKGDTKINTNVLETAVRSGLSFDLLQEVLPNLQSEDYLKFKQNYFKKQTIEKSTNVSEPFDSYETI